MAKCFMCGAAISQGILCGNCDKPRKTKAAKPAQAAPVEKPIPPTPPPSPARATSERVQTATAPMVEMDPFPKAPVVPFPVEAATPAITSIVSLMMVAGVPSILVAPDRSVKYVSDEAKKLFDATQADLGSLQTTESHIGVPIGPLSTPASAGLRVRNTNVLYSLVPLSGGASGAVLIFRYADASANAPFFTYVRETILGPLRSLRDSLIAASRVRGNEPFLADSAATIDQVLSSLELAPEVGDPSTQTRQQPSVTDIVHRVADRFRTFADLKGIQLQIDVQELDEHFRDSEQL